MTFGEMLDSFPSVLVATPKSSNLTARDYIIKHSYMLREGWKAPHDLRDVDLHAGVCAGITLVIHLLATYGLPSDLHIILEASQCNCSKLTPHLYCDDGSLYDSR